MKKAALVLLVVAAVSAGTLVGAATATRPAKAITLCVAANGVVTHAADGSCPGGTTTLKVAAQRGLADLFSRVDRLEDRSAPLVDADEDGASVVGGDCDDADDSQYPAATEVADDKDNDCDGGVDEGVTWEDFDGDGYTEADHDCDDSDAEVHRGAIESQEDSKDNDCDGVANELESGPKCLNGVDDDLDGKIDAQDNSCNIDLQDVDDDGDSMGVDDDDDGDLVVDGADPMPLVKGRF